MVLEKGDVVLTGTPKGVGSVRGGDVITAGIRVRGKVGGEEGKVGGKDDWKEVPEGKVQVEVRDREGGWDWGVEE